jgi:hypothetical protein
LSAPARRDAALVVVEGGRPAAAPVDPGPVGISLGADADATATRRAPAPAGAWLQGSMGCERLVRLSSLLSSVAAGAGGLVRGSSGSLAHGAPDPRRFAGWPAPQVAASSDLALGARARHSGPERASELADPTVQNDHERGPWQGQGCAARIPSAARCRRRLRNARSTAPQPAFGSCVPSRRLAIARAGGRVQGAQPVRLACASPAAAPGDLPHQLQ